MIKRDTLQRMKAVLTKDEMGGDIVELTPAEHIRAHVSINATFREITQFGIKDEMVLHVVVDAKLDEYIHTRYQYANKLFRLVRQVKQGSEYYATLVEVNGGNV